MTPSVKDKHSVLLIDESNSLLDLMELLLCGVGNISVTRTRSYVEGLESIKSDKIDLVVSDHCKKNKRNGLGFIREVSLHSPDTIRYLTSCCLSRYELENLEQEGIIHRYSTRPLSNTDITTHVTQCLELKKLTAQNH